MRPDGSSPFSPWRDQETKDFADKVRGILRSVAAGKHTDAADVIEIVNAAVKLNAPMPDLMKCVNCSGHIFIAEVEEQGESVAYVIYSHDEDTGCNDPEPEQE